MLIGFTGLKGSGKDTAAQVFVDRGFEHIKMAESLKLMLRSMLSYQLVPGDMIARMIDGDLKEEPSNFLGGRSPRHAMQTLGTEWGRDLIASSLWVGIAANRSAAFQNVVISDIRFPNEVEMVRDLGGKVYRIDRGVPADDMHVSEQLILNLDVDGEIANDFHDAASFRSHIAKVFRQG